MSILTSFLDILSLPRHTPTYSIDLRYLHEFSELPDYSRRILISAIELLPRSFKSPSDLLIDLPYLVSYGDKSYFYKNRNLLLDRQFLYEIDGKYMVSFTKVNYLQARELSNIKKELDPMYLKVKDKRDRSGKFLAPLEYKYLK